MQGINGVVFPPPPPPDSAKPLPPPPPPKRRIVYERDINGKLTLEAKFELERLNKEVVRRVYKETKADKDAYEETFVNLDPEFVFKRKPLQRLKWLEKSFKALLDSSIKANAVYDLVSHSKFLEGVNESVGLAIFELVEKNVGFFTARQQKYFLSPRFQLYKKHAVMTVLDSDDDEEEFKQINRPKKEGEKNIWQLRQERDEQRRIEDDKTRRAERKRQRDREADGYASSTHRSRSRSASPSSARSEAPPSDNDSTSQRQRLNDDTDAPVLGPRGKPKVERRVDPADNSMYTMAEFITEYGGTEEEPPHQWRNNKHSVFFFNT